MQECRGLLTGRYAWGAKYAGCVHIPQSMILRGGHLADGEPLAAGGVVD